MPQLHCCLTVSMSICESKENVADVELAAVKGSLQAPENVVFCFPDVVQLNTSVVAMLLKVKDGPVSCVGRAVDPGSDSYRRDHFSTCHDWYRLELLAQEELAFRRAGFSVVVIVEVAGELA